MSKSNNDRTRFGTLVFNLEYGRVSGDNDLDHLFRAMEFFAEKSQLYVDLIVNRGGRCIWMLDEG